MRSEYPGASPLGKTVRPAGRSEHRTAAFLTGALLLLAASAGCARVTRPSEGGTALATTSDADNAAQAITASALLDHIRTLSSDEFEGRAPGSHGEELTVDYIEQQFRSLGLEPGNPDGTFRQTFTLAGITPDPDMRLVLSRHATARRLDARFRDQFVAWSKRYVASTRVDADLVFVGYGVQAPEFEWDDFKGVDVRGKVLVVLINDPPVPDERVFGGKAMTYYGRWTYKFEKAEALGAAGCLIVHETEAAGYPWDVVTASFGGEQFDLEEADGGRGRLAVQGWITSDLARDLFAMAGKDFAALRTAAVTRDFHPVPLGVRARLTIRNRLRTIRSSNVIAQLPGSDPVLASQYVIYTAHWDHFGIGREVNGDRIYHGAVDNASGVATLIEIARAFKALRAPPRRTLVFLSVTGEEQGLLGSKYYVEHPLYPLAGTAAVINRDGMNVHGRTRDIVSIGFGTSTLDELVEAVAREQGRVVRPDAEPEKGGFYRSDHFSFVKHGVPAFDPQAGVDYLGRPEGWGLEMRRRYTTEDYHKPSDKIKDDWDLGGAVEDCRLMFLVGDRVANEARMPEWKPGAEFARERPVPVDLPAHSGQE
jgi:Zn-dependent M28 family amino/carboxypeptidase